MAKIVQRRRGTTTEHAGFTGSEGEITHDTTKNTLLVHDGVTQAGFPLAKEDMSNVVDAVGVTQLAVSEGTNGQLLQTNGAGTLSFTDAPDVSASSIGGDLSGTIGNAQIQPNRVSIVELNVSDGTTGQVLKTDGSGNLSFSNLSGDISGTLDASVINANTVDIAKLDVTDGTSGQILATNGSGDLYFTTNTGGSGATSTFLEEHYTAPGGYSQVSLITPVTSEESILVFIDGVSQPTSAFFLPTPNAIQFSSAPATGQNIKVLHLGIATQILDNSITGAKIAMGADVAGDIMYYNGTDYRRLAIGTTGQRLAVNSGATAPEWISIGDELPSPGANGNTLMSNGSSWTSVSAPALPSPSTSGNILTSNGSTWSSETPVLTGRQTLLITTDITSPVAQVEFGSSYINSTYTHYFLKLENIRFATDATFDASTDGLFMRVRLNGSTTGVPDYYSSQVDYKGQHGVPNWGVENSASWYSYHDSALKLILPQSNFPEEVSGEIAMFDAANPNNNFRIDGLFNMIQEGQNSNADVYRCSGAYIGGSWPANHGGGTQAQPYHSAISGIRIYHGNVNMTSGRLKLFGVF
jgi:hypothetical protein